MQQLTSVDYRSFIVDKPIVAVHFDAAWNSGRIFTRVKMLEAHAAFGERVGFAEVDVDAEAELARSIPVCNVSLVAYYRDGKLVAALIGVGQDVRARLERIQRGLPIGYKDGTQSLS